MEVSKNSVEYKLKFNSVILISKNVKQQHARRTKKKDIMEQINENEIDGLIQPMKETGIKGLMKYTDVLVLNHMM